jgi:hypothetical protein
MGSSVGIATGYGIDWGSIPGRARDFSLLHIVQTGSEARTAFYPVGTGSSFLGSIAAGA